MKAQKGDKIKLIETVCYNSVYGLVKVEKGIEMRVISRDLTDKGVLTDYTVKSQNPNFHVSINVHVEDKAYVIIS